MQAQEGISVNGDSEVESYAQVLYATINHASIDIYITNWHTQSVANLTSDNSQASIADVNAHSEISDYLIGDMMLTE